MKISITKPVLASVSPIIFHQEMRTEDLKDMVCMQGLETVLAITLMAATRLLV